MMLMDTNILMYAAGAPHPNKAPSVALLERVAAGQVEATIDTEVLREILHRYRAIGRWKEGRQVYDLTRRIFPMVIPVTAEILDAARGLMDQHPEIMARDALHAAVVLEERLEGIFSFDDDLDRIPGMVRRVPEG